MKSCKENQIKKTQIVDNKNKNKTKMLLNAIVAVV